MEACERAIEACERAKDALWHAAGKFLFLEHCSTVKVPYRFQPPFNTSDKLSVRQP